VIVLRNEPQIVRAADDAAAGEDEARWVEVYCY
jgi:hypothetical protein